MGPKICTSFAWWCLGHLAVLVGLILSFRGIPAPPECELQHHCCVFWVKGAFWDCDCGSARKTGGHPGVDLAAAVCGIFAAAHVLAGACVQVDCPSFCKAGCALNSRCGCLRRDICCLHSAMVLATTVTCQMRLSLLSNPCAFKRSQHNMQWPQVYGVQNSNSLNLPLQRP